MLIDLLRRRGAFTKTEEATGYENQYLTTTIDPGSTGTITFTIPAVVTTAYVTYVSYRKNKGQWITTQNSSSDVVITINVAAEDEIEWKGISTGYGNGSDINSCSRFGGDVPFDVSGNLMSMFYGDNFRGQTSFPGNKIRQAQHMFASTYVEDASNLILPATTCYGQAYMCLFENCIHLVLPPAVLPAPVVKSAMYYNMFKGCTSMTTAPTILAERIDTSGLLHYSGMFYGCSALQYNIPEVIHIGTARSLCCQEMFSGCSSITTAPEIDCNNYASGAQQIFRAMFYGCSSLTTPPERIYIDTADYSMFYAMFQGCSALQYTPIINIRNVGTRTYYAFNSMFYDCTSLTDASGINIYFPANSQWDGEQTFGYMFGNCTSLIHGATIHVYGTLITKSSRTFTYLYYNCQNLLYHDTEINHDIDSNATILADNSSYGNSSMFYNCKKITWGGRIIRSALRAHEFHRNYDTCIQLRDVYVKFDTNTAGNALASWLVNCGTISGATRTVHQAGSLSLPTGNVSGVPRNWTLDTTDWTQLRYPYMTMWIDDYEYGDVLDKKRGYPMLADQLNNTTPESSGANRFDYFGNTMTIDGVLYFVWRGTQTSTNNVSMYKLLTTTDNFYELYHESLEYWDEEYRYPDREGNVVAMTEVINKPFSSLAIVLKNDLIYNRNEDDMQRWIDNNRLVKIYRNQY